MRPATPEELELFNSLRENACPPGHFVGDGLRVVRKMLARDAVTKVLCSPEWIARNTLPDGIEVLTAPREKLAELVGFRLHQGLMALGRIPEPPPLRGTLHVALDGLSNTENVGAVFRTCAAFGVDGVIVGPGTASPWLRRSVRVSLAAALLVPVHFTDDLPGTLRPMNAWAAHIHGGRRTYSEIDYRPPCCIVLGGEDKGVTEPVIAACKGVIYIPMAEGWDCLNVAASAAVLLSEVRRQRAVT